MELLCADLDEKCDLLVTLRDYDIHSDSSKTMAWSRYWDRQQRRSLAIMDVLEEVGRDQAAGGPRSGQYTSLAAVEQCEALVIELNERRARGRAALETFFPSSLYLTIITLMVALVLCFVVRSSAIASDPLLAEKSVRLLFTMMTVCFAALLQIMADLADPFTGNFSLTKLGLEAISLANSRARGALAYSNTVDFPDETADDAHQPAMELEDIFAELVTYAKKRGLALSPIDDKGE